MNHEPQAMNLEPFASALLSSHHGPSLFQESRVI